MCINGNQCVKMHARACRKFAVTSILKIPCKTFVRRTRLGGGEWERAEVAVGLKARKTEEKTASAMSAKEKPIV